ncbi:hypothetical protein [Polynucleobacter arcticus]
MRINTFFNLCQNPLYADLSIYRILRNTSPLWLLGRANRDGGGEFDDLEN